jgi:hypothetical protein
MLVAAPMAVLTVGGISGCGQSPGSFLGLHDYQRDLLLNGGLLAITLLMNQNAQDGAAGGAGRGTVGGLNCWDLNGNGLPDADEDTNQDGVIDALDCQGAPGEPGQPVPGVDGINCWDLNENGTADAEEDTNGDGVVNVMDCQGADGSNGSSGPQGPQGPAGPELFDIFIEEFFTFSPEAESAGDVEEADDPILGQDPLAFRVAVPQIYDGQNPVTLRLFLWRESPIETGCTVLQLDVFRLMPNAGINQYGETRWVRLDDAGLPDPGYLVVDLPLHSPYTGDTTGGLGFSMDGLAAPQLLAFEIAASELNGDYFVLGAELFESEGFRSLAGVEEIFDSFQEQFCGYDDCDEDQNGDPDNDDDGVEDCEDGCMNDPNKYEPGECGCGEPDVDSDGDGLLDCNDECPNTPTDLDYQVGPYGCRISCTPGGSVEECGEGAFCQAEEINPEMGYCVNAVGFQPEPGEQ